MSSRTYIAFTLSMIVSSGPFNRVGAPNLFCWASAAHVPGSSLDDGRILILRRDAAQGNWREFAKTLSSDESGRVLELMNALGLPGRTLDVEGIVDTSDGWSHLSFKFQTEGRDLQLEISMQSSGFGGADAAQLRGLFRYLFSLAGYDEFDLSLYGDA